MEKTNTVPCEAGHTLSKDNLDMQSRLAQAEAKVKEVEIEAEARIKVAETEADARVKAAEAEAEAKVNAAKAEAEAKVNAAMAEADARVRTAEAKAEAAVAKVEAKLQAAYDAFAEEKARRIAAQEKMREARKEARLARQDNNRMGRAIEKLDAAVEKGLADKDKLAKQMDEARKAAAAHKERAKAAERRAKAAEKKAEQLSERAEDATKSINSLKDALKDLRKQLKNCRKQADREALRRVEELQAEIKRCQKEITRAKVRLSKDCRNSGIPSSRCPNVPTGGLRKPSNRHKGAQEGHPSTVRPLFEDVAEATDLLPLDKFLTGELYRPTELIRRHQQVDFILVPVVTELRSRGYLNLRTGKVEFTPFPEGFQNTINYGPRIKALLFCLTNRCNVSGGKAHWLLKEISGRRIDVSTGTIWTLVKEFAEKSEKERKKLFEDIAASNVIQADFTFGRMNGKQVAVLITSTPDGKVLYQARRKKGLAALPDSPLEHFNNVVVCDHESTFVLHCGSFHQECLQHVERELELIKEHEHMVTWPGKMKDWIQEAIHHRKQYIRGEVEHTEQDSADRIAKFKEIVALGEEEYGKYEGGRPLPGFTKGVNLLKRFKTDSDSYYLFLKDLTIPPTNGASERYAKVFKRKAAQVQCFRNFRGVEFYCDSQSVLQSLFNEGAPLFERVEEIFSRPRPRRGRGYNRKHVEDILAAMETSEEDSNCEQESQGNSQRAAGA